MDMTTLTAMLEDLPQERREKAFASLSEEESKRLESYLQEEYDQSHPEEWVTNILGDNIWEQQKTVLKSVRDNPRTAVRSCHGAGKSFISSRTAIWFLESFPFSAVVTTAPTFRQVKKILWQEIGKAYATKNPKLKGKPLLTEVEIAKGWHAFGFSTKDPNAFQGIHAKYVLVIFDEASGIPSPIWDAADGVLSNEFARFLAIGNPTDPASLFAREFRDVETSKIYISAFDTPNFTTFGITEEDMENKTWKEKLTGPLPYPALVSPSWVADKHRRWGKHSAMYVSRVLGKFPEEGTDTLITLASLENATRVEPNEQGRNEFGVDCAYFGSDSNVVYHLKGNTLTYLDHWGGQDTQASAARVIALARIHKPNKIKVDAIGYGAGVVDKIIADGFPGVRITVSESPTVEDEDELFLNQRAEFAWGLREMLRKGELFISEDNEQLFAESSSVKYIYTGKGKIQLEDKAAMKKRLGFSPDFFDAAVLAVCPDPEPSIVTDLSGLAGLGKQSNWGV